MTHIEEDASDLRERLEKMRFDMDSETDGTWSDSGNSSIDSYSSTDSVFSVHPNEIDFDDKCTTLLARTIMKCPDGKSINAVKEFARKKLVESVNGHTVKIGIIGEIGCGKSTLIKEIFGGAELKGNTSDSRRPISYQYPNHENIIFTEIPSVVSTRRTDREDYMDKIKIGMYDLILLLTDSHIREWSMWLGRQLNEAGIGFFYVRTKIDKTTAEDAAKFPRTYSEGRVIQRIRERCRESITTGKVQSRCDAFAVSSFFKDKWDFKRLVQALGEEMPRNKRRSLNLCLPPLTPHIIYEKQKAHAQRIWMIAALSVASGMYF